MVSLPALPKKASLNAVEPEAASLPAVPITRLEASGKTTAPLPKPPSPRTPRPNTTDLPVTLSMMLTVAACVAVAALNSTVDFAADEVAFENTRVSDAAV